MEAFTFPFGSQFSRVSVVAHELCSLAAGSEYKRSGKLTGESRTWPPSVIREFVYV